MRINKIYADLEIGGSDVRGETELEAKIESCVIDKPFLRGAIVTNHEDDQIFMDETKVYDIYDEFGEISINYGWIEHVGRINYIEDGELASEFGNLFEEYKFYPDYELGRYIGRNFQSVLLIIESESARLKYSWYGPKYENDHLDEIEFIDGKIIENLDLKSLISIKENYIEPALNFSKEAMKELICFGYDELSFENSVKIILNNLNIKISERIKDSEDRVMGLFDRYDL